MSHGRPLPLAARALRSCLVPAAFLSAALCLAADAPDLRPGPLPLPVQRLFAKLDVEPLAAIYTEDARALPEKFSRTCFQKMLQDPTYAKGAGVLRTLINEGAGADVAALWTDFSRLLTGPALLAMVPAGHAAPTDPDFRLLLLVTTPSEDTAAQLRALWPKPPPQSNSLLSVLRLQPVLPQDLVPNEKLPAWLTPRLWPNGDVCLRLLPRKLGAGLSDWIETSDSEGLDLLAQSLRDIHGEETEYLGLGLAFNGDAFAEELQLDLVPGNTPLARVVRAVKENAAPWEPLLTATPGEQDIVVLGQADLAALGPDLPYAAQAMERYLRGKKWSRGRGRLEDAFDPHRFGFLFRRLKGSFAIAARPALSGDIRVTLVTALNGTAAAAGPAQGEGEQMAKLREELIKGLASVGAEFETLQNVRSIGASPPLGAMFQGRGIFTTPLIGLSPGWAWLCSNSGAYQDLTTAFKLGKTLVAEQSSPKAASQAAHWRPNDVVRMQIELERVLKLLYASWLLSGEEVPTIGGWKVPGDLLPQPQVLNHRLGVLRTGMSRQGNTLRVHASSTFPFVSLLLPSALHEAADGIEIAHRFHQAAAAPEEQPDPPPKGKAGPPVIDGAPVIDDEPDAGAPRTRDVPAAGNGRKP
ncbi:MAG: hypothetical protein NTW87_34190 [Planctomycetota bacterium]|nr:hypothetical protein [Planctomycetota bacterium]